MHNFSKKKKKSDVNESPTELQYQRTDRFLTPSFSA